MALDLTPDKTSVSTEVRQYLTEIDSARKREKAWRSDASEVIKIYECDKPEEIPFNILYSNTETLLPALYNQVPRPVVKRRYNDADPIGKAASSIVERSLAYLLDAPDEESSSLDDVFAANTKAALLPGRGVLRIRYKAEFEKSEEKEGETATERVTKEELCVEEVPWDRFSHGYAKCWKDVPWVAFEHFMTKEELVETFGAEVAASIPLNAVKEALEEEDKKGSWKESDSGLKLGHVWELWDKEKKTVVFLAVGAPEVLKRIEDPLNLVGFFPCPQPLNFFQRLSGLTPQTLYAAYEEQAKELNSVTTRIKRIVKALKVRGFFDNTIEGITNLLEADDNTLLAAENVASLQQGRSLENSIWLMPLEKLVTVFQQLVMQRQQIKQVIYEITGISDILRGSSQASETATAQNIKNQWGTLRLKRMQKAVANYIRETLRMLGEAAVGKLSIDTLKAMTGLRFPMQAEKAQAQAMLQQAQAMQAQGQQVPPQALQQAQEVLALPSWEELITMLRDDLQRAYRIDIETNSTVDIEATEDKEQLGEFLNAVAQLLNGLAPLVESGTLSFEVSKELLLATVRRYRFGTEIEDKILTMQAPQKPEGPDPKQLEAMQKELQKQQDGIAKSAQDLEMAQKEAAMEMEYMKRELEMEKAFALKEVEAAKAAAMKELQIATQQAEQTHELQMQGREQKLTLRAQAQGTALENQRKDIESKAQKLSPEAFAQPILAALAQGLQQIKQELGQGLEQAMAQSPGITPE